MGNKQDRVEKPLKHISGPLIGENLLINFKKEIIKERIFQTMFGAHGERVFITDHPSLNETIVPAIMLDWRQETFNSNRAYFEGSLSGMVVLPTQLSGDTNGLRRVGSMLQRWMGGGLNLFDPSSESFVPGLVKFGYGTSFDYSGLADYSGIKFPSIQLSIPFMFDLELLRLQSDGFDPNQPLDDSDMGFLESIGLTVYETENNTVIFNQGVISATGQTNI